MSEWMAARRLIGTAIVLLLGSALTACGDGDAPKPAAENAVHAGHTFASPPPAAPLREGERFVDLSMARPFTPQPRAGGTDEYRCFLVDPGFTEAAFVTGSQFLPQNAAIVHHAIFFRVDPGDVAEARKLDDADTGDGWTCFGGTGIGAGQPATRQLRSGGAWIAAWAPGGKENLLRAETGYRLEAGSRLVMQIHYSLLATDGKAEGPDRSAIRLRVMAGTANLKPLQTTLLPAPVELPCPPGESGPLCDRDKSIMDVWGRFGEQAGATVAGLNILCNQGKPAVAGRPSAATGRSSRPAPSMRPPGTCTCSVARSRSSSTRTPRRGGCCWTFRCTTSTTRAPGRWPSRSR